MQKHLAFQCIGKWLIGLTLLAAPAEAKFLGIESGYVSSKDAFNLF